MKFPQSSSTKTTWRFKIKLIIVGKGDQKTQLKKLSNLRNLKKNITWINYISETNQFYKSIDTFCIASLYEGLGLVLLEAMYNKVPIVASNINVFKEIIKDKSDGLLFNVHSPKNLALKIIETMNKKITARITKNAFIKVKKNFDLKKTLYKTNIIYDKMLNTKNIK